MKFSTTVILIAIFVSTITMALAASVRTKPKGPVKPDSYIVVLKSGEAMEHHIEGITRISARSPGSRFSINHRYEILNAYSAHATGASLSRIFSCPEVEYVEADGIASIYGDLHEANEGRATECNDVPAEIRDDPGGLGGRAFGEGVMIILIDTGIKGDHSDFRNPDGTTRVLPTVVYGGYSPEDGNGHGTMVAGRAVGNTYGVATSATILPVKAFSNSGQAFVSDIIKGIMFAIQRFLLLRSHAILVISAKSRYDETFNLAVSTAIERGLHVVVPAGDDNMDAMNVSPASANGANTVGAIDGCSSIASFSNYGAMIDVFAWGTGIPVPGIRDPDAWETKSSTGMSAAYVAGASAVALGHKEDLVSPVGLNIALKHYAVKDVLEAPDDTTKLRAQLWWNW